MKLDTWFSDNRGCALSVREKYKKHVNMIKLAITDPVCMHDGHVVTDMLAYGIALKSAKQLAGAISLKKFDMIYFER